MPAKSGSSSSRTRLFYAYQVRLDGFCCSRGQPGRSSGRFLARWPCSTPVAWPTSIR